MNFSLAFNKYFIQTYKNNSKSYYKNGKWNLIRCRIEPKLIPELLFEYILSPSITVYELGEKYLKLTREMQEITRKYQDSKGMDSSAILCWFNICRPKDYSKISFSQFSKEEIMQVINEYINKIMKINIQGTKFFTKWKEYYEFEKLFYDETKYYSSIINTISEYSNNLKYKYVQKHDNNISENCHSFNKNIDSKLNNELIGNFGEDIVLKYLHDKYPKAKIKLMRDINKYCDHDIQININGTLMYCEVKSSRKAGSFDFYISSNEIRCYEKNKNNYWLFFVSNIDPTNNRTGLLPILTFSEKPEIETDTVAEYLDNDIFHLLPCKFLGRSK